jgi:DNA-binding XRE family transcriptional regulator
MSGRPGLVRARRHLGLSRAELAKQIGVRRETVFSVETGLRDPSLAVMTRWAEALGPGVTLDIFRPLAADAAE